MMPRIYRGINAREEKEEKRYIIRPLDSWQILRKVNEFMKTPRASTQGDNLQIKMYFKIVPGPESSKPGTCRS